MQDRFFCDLPTALKSLWWPPRRGSSSGLLTCPAGTAIYWFILLLMNIAPSYSQWSPRTTIKVIKVVVSLLLHMSRCLSQYPSRRGVWTPRWGLHWAAPGCLRRAWSLPAVSTAWPESPVSVLVSRGRGREIRFHCSLTLHSFSFFSNRYFSRHFPMI